MIRVYHALNTRDATFRSPMLTGFLFLRTLQLENEGTQLMDLEFQHVANVDSLPGDDQHNLELAYRLTNHIDMPWTQNKGVTPIGTHHRSTSVGDVMTIWGHAYVVSNVGFERLSGGYSDAHQSSVNVVWHLLQGDNVSIN